MATLKPTTPLRAPNKGPLKPTSPLHPNTAPKTPISHPHRRQGFQSHTSTSEQRQWRFQTTAHLADRARRRHPWVAAGPGRASRRRTEPDNSDPAPQVWRAPEGPEGTGGLRGTGPGCGAHGRWRGLAGLRADAPSEARGADGSRAGRHPRAHKAARPHKAQAAPETPAGPQATTRENKNRRPRRICGFIVREGGVEPPLHHWNTDLNRARLPIPPLARTQKE